MKVDEVRAELHEEFESNLKLKKKNLHPNSTSISPTLSKTG